MDSIKSILCSPYFSLYKLRIARVFITWAFRSFGFANTLEHVQFLFLYFCFLSFFLIFIIQVKEIAITSSSYNYIINSTTQC